MSKRLDGLVAAVFTPMRSNGDVNCDAVPKYIDHLVSDGVSGIFVCGTTGEFSALTCAERRAVSEAFAAGCRGRLPVVIHVGHDCLRESRALARHACGLGVSAIAAVPPGLNRPRSAREVVDCLAEISDAAPDMPLYYYHLPSVTEMRIPAIEVLREASTRLPNLVGVKFTSEDIMDFHECLDFSDGGYECLFGRDEMFLSALATGATAAVGGTYNFAAPLYRRLWEEFSNGRLPNALRRQFRAIEMIRILREYGLLPAMKELMVHLGLDLGPTRLPLHPLSDSEKAAFRSDLDRISFFEWGRSG